MNVAWLFSRARRLANVNDVQWNDTDILADANVYYHDVVETIVNEVWEDLFIRPFLTNTVIDQTWYDLQEATATVLWHKKIKRVTVKFASTDDYPQVLSEVSENSLNRDVEYYADNTPTIWAFYYLEWNKIYIYPSPQEEIVWGLKIESSVTPIDLVWGWAESTILVPRQFHNVIVQWMLIAIYQHLNKRTELIDAENKYESMKNAMVTDLSDRVSSPLWWSLPNLDFLS